MTEPTAPPEFDERPIPRWQKLTAVAVLVLLVAALVLWHARLAADFWPPDASRIAPNLIASVIQAAVVLLVAALIWPPTRRRIHQFVSSHTAPLHAHLEAAREQRERIAAAHQAAHTETQRHLKHIIDHHPDIPPLP